MSKKKKKKNKRKSRQQPKKQPLKEILPQHPKKNKSFFSFLFRYWAYVWGVLGPILTVFALYYTFFPSVSITPANELNIKNPCQIPFIIENPNIYSITMNHFYFHIKTVTTETGTTITNLNIGEILKQPVKIYPKRKTTQFFSLDKYFKTSLIKSGIVSAEIQYETPWYYRNINFEQFYRIHIIDNKVYWAPIR